MFLAIPDRYSPTSEVLSSGMNYILGGVAEKLNPKLNPNTWGQPSEVDIKVSLPGSNTTAFGFTYTSVWCI
jgi:hypothetical protein